MQLCVQQKWQALPQCSPQTRQKRWVSWFNPPFSLLKHEKCFSNGAAFLFLRVTFCAEHARRNALVQQAQMRKASSGPSPEVLLSQLSGYNRPDSGAHGQEGRSEAGRLLGKLLLAHFTSMILVVYFSCMCFSVDDDSWSEEEEDPVVLDPTWRGDPDSEAESLDSDHEDPLK